MICGIVVQASRLLSFRPWWPRSWCWNANPVVVFSCTRSVCLGIRTSDAGDPPHETPCTDDWKRKGALHTSLHIFNAGLLLDHGKDRTTMDIAWDSSSSLEPRVDPSVRIGEMGTLLVTSLEVKCVLAAFF